jgi:hypothetical protein
MKKFASAFVVLTILAAPAWAQRQPSAKTQPLPAPVLNPAPVLAPLPTPTPAPTSVTVQPTLSVSSELKATPEMWFYEQYMREYKDPKNAVRANAANDFQQRSNRLATMRWFGYSNSRPRVGADPMNVYPPSWSSNTPLQPNRWQGTGGQPYYVARPESDLRSY